MLLMLYHSANKTLSVSAWNCQHWNPTIGHRSEENSRLSDQDSRSPSAEHWWNVETQPRCYVKD